MRVGIYMREWQMAAREAHAGFVALGHRAVFRRHGLFGGRSDLEPFDLVLTIGFGGPGRLVADTYRAAGVPVIIMDAPWFGPYGEGLWRLSLGPSPSWLTPEAATTARAVELGATPRFGTSRAAKDAPVIVLGQMPGDAAHGFADAAAVRSWALATIDAVAAQVDNPVRWRPHPADPVELPGVDALDPGEPIVDALAGAYAAVTETSGAGLDALALGVPVVATGAPAYGYLAARIRDLPRIEPPKLADVQALFGRLAYQHYSGDELATGKGIALFIDLATGQAIDWPEPPKPKAPAAKTTKRARKNFDG